MAMGIKKITLFYKNGQKDKFEASAPTKRLYTERRAGGKLAVVEYGNGVREDLILTPFDEVKRVEGKTYNES